MTKMFKKCSTDQRFIRKRNTTYKIHTLEYGLVEYTYICNKIYRLIIFSISFLLQNLCLESRLTDAYFFLQKVWSYLTHSVNRLSCKHANCVKMGVCLTPEDKIPFAKKNKTRQGFQMSIYAKNLRFLGELSYLQIKKFLDFWFMCTIQLLFCLSQNLEVAAVSN